MEKEEIVFRSRIQDLAERADRRCCILYSDFLGLNEQSIVLELARSLPVAGIAWYGGYPQAERRIAAFLPDDMQEPDFPINCVRIRPASRKFSEELSHRDVLGALMHLGVERSRIGDIAMTDDGVLVFCSKAFSEILCEELRQVKHTSVICEPYEICGLEYEPKVSRIRSSVASVRLDALMAAAFHASRSSLSGLIEGGKVFVNGKLVTSGSYTPREGEIVSVRGHGRFRYVGAEGSSKKGRIWVSLDLFV